MRITARQYRFGRQYRFVRSVGITGWTPHEPRMDWIMGSAGIGIPAFGTEIAPRGYLVGAITEGQGETNFGLPKILNQYVSLNQ